MPGALRPIEDRIREGANPTGRQISERYLTLLREYYGHGQGGVEVSEVYRWEWMNNFVPFLNYAHHNWPVAIGVASAVVERLRAGDERAVRPMTSDVDARRVSDRYYDILRDVGIDMASRTPYEASMRRMTTLLDDLEQTLDRMEAHP